MIRNQELIDKLTADLHFHNFLSVHESDNIFSQHSTRRESLVSFLSDLGLTLDPDKDFYHGGQVMRDETISYIYNYLDDVFIDWFIRTYDIKSIIFPKGFSYQKITPEGIVYTNDCIILNIRDIYDRCTFVDNIWRMFKTNMNVFLSLFPKNGFLNHFYITEARFGLHSFCHILKNDIHFDTEWNTFVSHSWQGKSPNTQYRGREIMKYIGFINENHFEHTIPFLFRLDEFRNGFQQLKDNHLFGDYTILDILFLYSLLINKFQLNEEAFLLSLCHCLEPDFKSIILDDFIKFEETHTTAHGLEAQIQQNDLYLRFAAHTNSKAFSFGRLNDANDIVMLFKKEPIIFPKIGNTLPLPYYYNQFSN